MFIVRFSCTQSHGRKTYIGVCIRIDVCNAAKRFTYRTFQKFQKRMGEKIEYAVTTRMLMRALYDTDTPEVLRGLNLKIPPGSKVAVMGRSGCGKSTLLQIMSRWERG